MAFRRSAFERAGLLDPHTGRKAGTLLGQEVREWCIRARAAGMEEIKKRGLIVATEDDFRPFEFVKDGKPTGFDNELVDELRKYAPFPIKQEILELRTANTSLRGELTLVRERLVVYEGRSLTEAPITRNLETARQNFAQWSAGLRANGEA